MNIVLISTSDFKGGRADLRDRMLQSLVESARTVAGDRLVLALLLQNCAGSWRSGTSGWPCAAR